MTDTYYTGKLTPSSGGGGNVYTPKGNVASYSDLPTLTNVEIGWVYNVLDTGKNYVCALNGSDEKFWDDIGGIVDLSGKQDVLTAGNNIEIQNNEISALIPSTTPRFSINNGNKNNLGTMDILSYSGSTLSFKVDDGTAYETLQATSGYSGEQFEKTSLSTVSTSNLSAATYNVFIPKTGNQPYLLNNTIFVQAEKPSDEPIDTIPVMTSNTTPYGTVTSSNISTVAQYPIYNVFNPVSATSQKAYAQGTGTITYTYDSNYRPQAGLYQVKYTQTTGNRVNINWVRVNYEDGTYTEYTRSSNKSSSFTTNIVATQTIVSLSINVTGASGSDRVGYLQLLKPAITAEGTLWVNNGVEPLEVQARDENAQWQPFNDVLAGTCTVNSSHNITAVSNQGFNYFSTINMHNISTTAHEDIRSDIKELETLTTQINRTGTSSFQGLTKLYTQSGSAADGTMTQAAITEALNALEQRIVALEGGIEE